MHTVNQHPYLRRVLVGAGLLLLSSTLAYAQIPSDVVKELNALKGDSSGTAIEKREALFVTNPGFYHAVNDQPDMAILFRTQNHENFATASYSTGD